MAYGKSVAHRKIPSRKRDSGSQTGFKTDPYHRREIWFESNLEAKCLLVLMADPDVHEVREQQTMPRFWFRGQSVLHYMDFLVIWRSGYRTAFSVKYLEERTEEFEALLKAAAAEVGDAFAHHYRTLSETDISQTQIWNATHILSAAKDFDFEAQKFLATELRSAPRQIRVGDCDRMLGDGFRGSRAAMALVKTGRLVIPEGQRLGPDTVLRNLFTN